jgi:hypothetical protein
VEEGEKEVDNDANFPAAAAVMSTVASTVSNRSGRSAAEDSEGVRRQEEGRRAGDCSTLYRLSGDGGRMIRVGDTVGRLRVATRARNPFLSAAGSLPPRRTALAKKGRVRNHPFEAH